MINDMLGLTQGHVPKFVKKFANLHPQMLEAVKAYIDEVNAGTFPAEEHCYSINEEIIEKLY